MDLTAEEMAAHSESIDDDLANSPTAHSSLNSILQERLDTSPTAQDKKRASGRSRLANASFPGANCMLSCVSSVHAVCCDSILRLGTKHTAHDRKLASSNSSFQTFIPLYPSLTWPLAYSP